MKRGRKAREGVGGMIREGRNYGKPKWGDFQQRGGR